MALRTTDLFPTELRAHDVRGLLELERRPLPAQVAPAIVLAFDVLAATASAALLGGRPSVVLGVLVLTTLAVTGGYRRHIRLSALEEAPWLATRCAALALFVGLLASDGASRAVLVQAAVLAPVLVAGRAAAYAAIRVLRYRGLLSDRTLLVGVGDVGSELAWIMLTHREYGLAPVGFLDRDGGDEVPIPRVGEIEDLEEVLSTGDIDRIVVAFGQIREVDLLPVLRSALSHDVEVHVVPRFFDLGIASRGRDIESLWGITLVRVRRAALRSAAWRLKRAVDVTSSGMALILTAPVLALVALAVRLTSPGPILFRQSRVGQHGRTFDVLKFRTMKVNDDSDRTWSVGEDPRRTSIGKFLRSTSLDELPQLWNIFRGDMSLVGPRPERPFFVDRFSHRVPGYTERHRVPAGLTGWSQVHGLRGNTSIRERARFDNYYIENWSLWADVVIILRTFTALFRGR